MVVAVAVVLAIPWEPFARSTSQLQCVVCLQHSNSGLLENIKK